MFSYRPDQGVYARGIAFWALTAYAGLAGNRFFYEIQGWDLGFDLGGKVTTHLLADPLPVLGMHLTPALLIGVGVFLALTYLAWRVANHPKLADLLIDTEAEMKKVTWPSFEDSKASSIVVIGCVAFLLAFLWVADTALGWFFSGVVY